MSTQRLELPFFANDSVDTFPCGPSVVIEICSALRSPYPAGAVQRHDPPQHTGKQLPRQMTIHQQRPVLAHGFLVARRANLSAMREPITPESFELDGDPSTVRIRTPAKACP